MIRIVRVVGMSGTVGMGCTNAIGCASECNTRGESALVDYRLEEIRNIEWQGNLIQVCIEYTVVYLNILGTLRKESAPAGGDIVDAELHALGSINGVSILICEHSLIVDDSWDLRKRECAES